MSDPLQPVLAIVLVLSLLGGALYLLRRRGIALPAYGASGRQGHTNQLKVLARAPLGPQHALHLVRIGKRVVLVATGPGSCQVTNFAPEGGMDR